LEASAAVSRVAPEFELAASVAQADLVALVQHRRAAKTEQHEQRGSRPTRVVVRPTRRQARHVVIRTGPRRPRVDREDGLDALHDVSHHRGFERGVDEREVERKMQLVVIRAVERAQ